MSEFRRYYWDSGVFCSFLTEEKDRFEVVQDLLKEAESGRIEIVTSTFALVEVLKCKGHESISAEDEDNIRNFFEYPFIKFVNADREVCEASRNYVWRHRMKSKDAVHMATAVLASRLVEIHGLFSWDSDFVSLNGKDGIAIPISHPFMLQGVLRLEGDEPGVSEEGTSSNDQE